MARKRAPTKRSKPRAKPVAKTVAPKESSKSETSINVRKIENGYIVRETIAPKTSRGQWKEKETFTEKKPVIKIGT